MDDRSRKLQLEILKVLKKSDKPMGSVHLSGELAAMGVDINERTVRFHLQRMDEQGLTEKISRRAGRVISPAGLDMLNSANVMSRMSFIVSKIDGLSYNMTFDTAKMAGSVVINVSFIPIEQLSEAIEEIELAFQANLGMGRLVLLKKPGEKIGGATIPEGKAGLGTVCSVTLNGALLKMGVPIVSRYGCLLRMEKGVPIGFTELVDYLGVTVDPLELFIRAGMTTVGQTARSGSGLIGVSFREVPAAAGKVLDMINERLRQENMDGILAIGKPNQPLLNVPVNEGMIGVAIIGGTNPVAAAHEIGIQTENIALHSLIDYSELYDFENLRSKIEML